jgi:dTDP-4-dehydrorhamnose 3,5-epimerase
MEIISTELQEVKVIIPRIFRDERGSFQEIWNASRFRESGLPEKFMQLNHSLSQPGVLRGIHFQLGRPQGKLVRVLQGKIWDVAVDLRPASPTFRKWIYVELSAENRRLLYVPPGFGHGFCVPGNRGKAAVEYFTTSTYYPSGDRSLAWNDPQLGIAWPLENPRLSEKDRQAPLLRDILPELEEFRGL